MKKISLIFGTRPEAIKLAPVITILKQQKEFEINVCCTAQHREMVDQILSVFDIVPDVDLNIMKKNQSLSGLTSVIISEVDNYLTNYKPDLILVQGDTTTVMAVSLVAFYHKIKVGHVEAGLRTYQKYSPFPEELNRTLTSRIADIHFAPTENSKRNLIKEGIDDKTIYVTGNTVIDALYYASSKVDGFHKIELKSGKSLIINDLVPYILITGHRRENFGDGFENICYAILKLAEKFTNHKFIYPVHLNPNVQKPVNEILSKQKNVLLIDPQPYLEFIGLVKQSYIILTDSGGVQEEAPSLGKPVLVMREDTERPEAIKIGTAKLVGTNVDSIVQNVSHLIENPSQYQKMASIQNPYGDGKAAERIKNILLNQLL